MAAITDLLNTNWGPYSHTEVEEAIKEKFREIDRALENASSEGGIGYDELSKAVRDLLDLASTALQPGSIANWAKQPNKPGYTVGEIIYDGLTTLSQKLAAMDTAIQQAAESGAVEPDSAMSDSSENAVQNKIVKAYIDAVSLRLDTLIGSNNVQGVIDTFNEVKAFLNGINTSDPTLYNTLQGLQSSIDSLQSSLSGKLSSSDIADNLTTNSASKVLSAKMGKKLADEKQDALQYDALPSSNSQKMVKSGGIYTALNNLLSNISIDTTTGNWKIGNTDTGVKARGIDGVASGDEVVVVHDLSGEPSDLEEGQVAVLGADLGEIIGKVINTNTSDNNRATPYSLWVGTSQELENLDEYDENTIYLVGIVPTVATKYTITKTIGQNITVSGTNAASERITEGKPFSITLSPASGYTIDTATGTMVNGTLTKTENQDGSVTFSTSSVTGAISITASASVHITGITVTAATQNGNTIALSATVSPANAENVTLAWSLPSGTTKFSISGSGTSATLTLLSGATTSDSVVVTCADTNASSGTATGTLTVTPTSDFDDSVPITAVNSVSYSAGSATNTYQFTADVTPAGGNTPAIVWSVVASPSGTASINSSTGLLTITEDCTVVVTATSGEHSASSSSISLTYTIDPNAPIVWEDSTMESFMLSKVTHANNGYITYAEAAVFNSVDFKAGSEAASYPFTSIKDVVTKFNEWQYFTSLTSVNLAGFSALTEIKMPSTVVLGSNNTRISGTALTSIVIPEGVTTYPFAAISGSAITSISFPSTLTTTSAPNGGSTINCANLKVLDFSGTALTSIDWYRPNLGGVQIIKFPPSLTSIGSSSNAIQLARNSASLSWVEIGTANGGSSISEININNYSGHAYNIIIHTTTPPAFTWADIGFTAIYVPDAAVDTYKAASGFSSYSSKIKGLSELPSDWDTPTTSE